MLHSQLMCPCTRYGYCCHQFHSYIKVCLVSAFRVSLYMCFGPLFSLNIIPSVRTLSSTSLSPVIFPFYPVLGNVSDILSFCACIAPVGVFLLAVRLYCHLKPGLELADYCSLVSALCTSHICMLCQLLAKFMYVK